MSASGRLKAASGDYSRVCKQTVPAALAFSPPSALSPSEPSRESPCGVKNKAHVTETYLSLFISFAARGDTTNPHSRGKRRAEAFGTFGPKSTREKYMKPAVFQRYTHRSKNPTPGAGKVRGTGRERHKKSGRLFQVVRCGSGGRTRTSDLRVMSPTSCQLLYPAMYR